VLVLLAAVLTTSAHTTARKHSKSHQASSSSSSIGTSKNNTSNNHKHHMSAFEEEGFASSSGSGEKTVWRRRFSGSDDDDLRADAFATLEFGKLSFPGGDFELEEKVSIALESTFIVPLMKRRKNELQSWEAVYVEHEKGMQLAISISLSIYLSRSLAHIHTHTESRPWKLRCYFVNEELFLISSDRKSRKYSVCKHVLKKINMLFHCLRRCTHTKLTNTTRTYSAIHTQARTHTQTNTHTNTQTHAHTHTHTHTHLEMSYTGQIFLKTLLMIARNVEARSVTTPQGTLYKIEFRNKPVAVTYRGNSNELILERSAFESLNFRIAWKLIPPEQTRGGISAGTQH
jgi:hypothetical protein